MIKTNGINKIKCAIACIEFAIHCGSMPSSQVLIPATARALAIQSEKTSQKTTPKMNQIRAAITTGHKTIHKIRNWNRSQNALDNASIIKFIYLP